MDLITTINCTKSIISLCFDSIENIANPFFYLLHLRFFQKIEKEFLLVGTPTIPANEYGQLRRFLHYLNLFQFLPVKYLSRIPERLLFVAKKFEYKSLASRIKQQPTTGISSAAIGSATIMEDLVKEALEDGEGGEEDGTVTDIHDAIEDSVDEGTIAEDNRIKLSIESESPKVGLSAALRGVADKVKSFFIGIFTSLKQPFKSTMSEIEEDVTVDSEGTDDDDLMTEDSAIVALNRSYRSPLYAVQYLSHYLTKKVHSPERSSSLHLKLSDAFSRTLFTSQADSYVLENEVSFINGFYPLDIVISQSFPSPSSSNTTTATTNESALSTSVEASSLDTQSISPGVPVSNVSEPVPVETIEFPRMLVEVNGPTHYRSYGNRTMIRRRDLIKEYYYRKLFSALRQSNLNRPHANSTTDSDICVDTARTNATSSSGEVPGILYEKIDLEMYLINVFNEDHKLRTIRYMIIIIIIIIIVTHC
jgi:hypothetical protein